ncbi:alpha/beta hydrolase [Pseudomonas sp. BN411]|nr:alpha/beta hydrolase [Pseudomonas sp. BN411]MDH4656953.1 alpha/beta hydrolase [Pseudomonas sp. BN606]
MLEPNPKKLSGGALPRTFNSACSAFFCRKLLLGEIRMSLDPEVTALLSLIEEHLPALGSVPIDVYRGINGSLVSAMPPGPELHQVKDMDFAGPGGNLRLRLYVPQAVNPELVILYFHGGGWTVGDLDSHDAALRMLAKDTGAALVSVDYRLAPEHSFPAAIDDAYAALTWVSDALPRWFGSPLPLVVGGDSAGGNLSAVVSIMARDRQGPSITAQLLLYPSTAGCEFINSPHLCGEEPPFLRLSDINWFFDQYVPDCATRRDPRFAPLLMDDLRGLPPALVLTAQYDLLTAEGKTYSRRLKDAGTPCEFLCYDGTVHGFFSLAPTQRQAVQARKDIGAFLNRVVRRAPIKS